MASVGNNNQSSSVKSINRSDGSALLLSDRLASLNFDGFIPRSNTSIYASDLKVGQTIFNSDPSVQDNSFFITRIDSVPVTVEDIEENSYFLYFLGDSNLEEAYTYGAENENGSFSQNHLFNSYRDDISGVSIGTDGWMITNQGNAVFSNVFVRGTVEATSGKIDGVLSVGEDVNGDPLVTIGKNLFDSTPFEGSSSEHSGIFLNRHNYFMGYDEVQSVPILSVVAEDSTRNVTLRKAVFTLANHTLSVRDQVSIFGFTEDKFLELDNVFPVEEVTQNTFTVYYKNEIVGTTNPISVNLKVESFALDNIYTVTELNLVNVVSTEDTSILKIYIDKQYTGLFEQDFSVTINSFTSPVFGGNPNYLISSIVVTEGEDDPDYLLTSSLRADAGTYTTGLGQINSSLTNYKFKVGNDLNSMSFNSFTGALSVTGTINADSGNFTNTVTIGKNNTSYSVYNKKLLGGVATLTTSTIHNFVIGDTVIVSGVDETFNGTYVVTGVPTIESFTYNKTADPVVSTPVSPLGTAAIGEAESGKLSVGYGANQISIDGTGVATTSAIYAGAGAYGDPDTGFFMDASGRFSLKDKLTFSGNLSSPVLAVKGEITADTLDVGGEEGITYDGETVRIGTDVTIIGGVTATSFGIDANNYWNTTGNLGDFRVGSATSYLFWNQTDTPSAGDGNLEVRGEITATSGSIEGDFEVNGDAQINGSLFVGDSPVTGQRVSINDSGIVGVDSSNNTIFNLPATSNSVPTITNFNILEAKITGAGENAYLIAGTTEDPANNVIVRGDKTGGQAAAIYSTINGVATSATTGNGFYLDDTGKFRFAQGSNVISGSGGNLSVTGAINATSGNFTSTVTIGQSATQGKLQVGTSTGVGSSWFEIIGTDDKATTVIKTKDAVYQTSGVWLSADGKFSLGNALTWDGATLTISGNDGPTGIIPGNGVDVNQANEITSISGINGLTISSGLTTGARVQLDSTGLKAYNSGGTNTIAINNDGSALFTGGTSSTSTFFNATPEASLAAVGNVTSESNIIDAGSGVNFITSGFKVGMFISGTGIPSATYIVSLTSMALTISRYATADNASVTITGYNSSFGSGGSTIDNSKFRVDTFGNINASAGRLGFFTLASDGIYGTNIQITNTGMKFFDPESLLGVLPGTAGSIEAELGSNGITISTGGVFSPRGNIVPGGVSMTSPNGSLFSVYSPYYLDGFDSTTYYSGEASILNSFLITQPDIGQGSATLDFTGNLNVNSGLLRVVTTSGNGADFQSSNTASNVFLITPIEGGVRQTGNQIYFNGTTQQWVVEGDFNGANSTEIGYLAGVTSNIQTQLNSKLGGVLTASRALVTNTSGLVAVSAVTSTELGYLDGVTSAIQTQLNGKLGTTAKAADANLLDGINSTSFLRSDASDSWASATFTLKPDGATYGLVFDAGFTDTAGDPVLVSNGTAHAYGRIGRPGNRMYAGYFSVLFAGTSQITSDIREKTSIENSDLGLDFINMLRPVKYKMINGIKKQVDAEGNPVEDTPGTRWHYGLIAQEVKETLDSYNLDSAMWAVEDFETNPDGRQAISYNQIVSPLIKAVQQLSETVEVLENRLAALES